MCVAPQDIVVKHRRHGVFTIKTASAARAVVVGDGVVYIERAAVVVGDAGAKKFSTIIYHQIVVDGIAADDDVHDAKSTAQRAKVFVEDVVVQRTVAKADAHSAADAG